MAKKFPTKTVLISGAILGGAWLLFSKPDAVSGGGGGTSFIERIRDIGSTTKDIVTNTRDTFSSVAGIGANLLGDVGTGVEFVKKTAGTGEILSDVGAIGIEPFSTATRGGKVMGTGRLGTVFSGNLPFGIGGLSGQTFIPALDVSKKGTKSSAMEVGSTTEELSTTKPTTKKEGRAGFGTVLEAVTRSPFGFNVPYVPFI